MDKKDLDKWTEGKAEAAKESLGSLESGKQELAPTATERPVWEMTESEFKEFAKAKNSDALVTEVRSALKQIVETFRRSALWYWTTGKWLNYVKDNKVYGRHGDWEKWCWEGVGINGSTAWKFRQFQKQFSTKEGTPDLKSFGSERFSLERALGYKAPDRPYDDTELPAKTKKTPPEGKKPEPSPEDKPDDKTGDKSQKCKRCGDSLDPKVNTKETFYGILEGYCWCGDECEGKDCCACKEIPETVRAALADENGTDEDDEELEEATAQPPATDEAPPPSGGSSPTSEATKPDDSTHALLHLAGLIELNDGWTARKAEGRLRGDCYVIARVYTKQNRELIGTMRGPKVEVATITPPNN